MPRPRFALLDRYLLASMVPPMAAAFLVVLVALLLYRILEIFNLLASSGAQFQLITRMIGALLPHYVGLALPAGFFISMFVVIAKMADGSEIDALLAGGLQMERIAAPFLVGALVVAAASAALLGYLQPYGRYDYNLGLNEALGSGWNARLQARAFLAPSDRFVITAEAADPSGRRLTGVFVRRIDASGQEQVLTARRGALAPSDDGRRVLLSLLDGQQLVVGKGEPTVGGFGRLDIEAPAAAAIGVFRPRGNTARELTFGELLTRMAAPADAQAGRDAAAEFHSRVVRTISPLFLPLLALPLGIAAKRGRRTGGLIVAAVVLLLYEYAIDMGQALGRTGELDAATGLWGIFAIFASLCVWVWISSRERPGQTPVNMAVEWIADLTETMRRTFRRPRTSLR